MRRQLLLLAGLALGAGGAACGSRDCGAESLRIYWTPGGSGPAAGFSVPGLAAAGLPAQLDCAGSALDNANRAPNGPRVEVRVNDQTVNCTSPSFCVGTDWACDTGGVDVVGYPLQQGGNKVEIFGYNGVPSQATMTYYGRLDQPAGCNLTTVGVVSYGLDGTLGLDYAFTPNVACHANTSIAWDLRSGPANGAIYQQTDVGAGAVACGSLVDVKGGAVVPAGVYTLVNMAEVDNGNASVSYHAYCSTTPFAHAGNESLAVDMPVSTQTCF